MYPVIAHIYGPLAIHSYGLLIVIGLALALYLVNKNPLRKKLMSEEELFSFVLWQIAAAVIGGKLLHMIVEWHEYRSWTDFFAIWEGGFSILGSLIAVGFTSFWYLYNHNIPVLPTFDLIARYAPILQGFGRLGCFFAGCCYGQPTDLFCGITFTNPDSLAPLYISLHPTQIYSAVSYLVIFLLLKYWYKKFKKPGQLAMVYLMLAGLERLLIDFFRDDRITSVILDTMGLSFISVHQMVALGIIFTGFIGFIVCSGRKGH